MTEVQLLRGSVESLQRQRDEWISKHKECTRLLGEAMQDTTNVSVERDALKDAARLALDALLPFGGHGLIMVNQAIAALQEAL